MRGYLSFLIFGFILTGCNSSEEGPYNYSGYGGGNGSLDVKVEYSSNAHALTIHEIPEGEKDYIVIEIYEATDRIGPSASSYASAVFEETYGADSGVIEIDELPTGVPLLIEVTTYDFSGYATYVGRGQKTLTDDQITSANISMKAFGVFIQSVNDIVRIDSGQTYTRDKVEFTLSVVNNTHADLKGMSASLRSLTEGVSPGWRVNVREEFKPFSTKTIDVSDPFDIQLLDSSFSGPATVDVIWNYTSYTFDNVSTVQRFTINVPVGIE